jgi:hypothetical protein
MKKRNIRPTAIIFTGRFVKKITSLVENFEYLTGIDLSHVSTMHVGERTYDFDPNHGDFVVEEEIDEDDGCIVNHNDFHNHGNFLVIDDDVDDDNEFIFGFVSNPFYEDEVIFLISRCNSLTELVLSGPVMTINLINSAGDVFSNLTQLRFDFNVVFPMHQVCACLTGKCQKLKLFSMNAHTFDFWWRNAEVIELITANPFLNVFHISNIDVSDSLMSEFIKREFKTLRLRCYFDTESAGTFQHWSALVKNNLQLTFKSVDSGESRWIDYDVETQSLKISSAFLYEHPEDINRFLKVLKPVLLTIVLENIVISTEMIACLGKCQPSLVDIKLLNVTLMCGYIKSQQDGFAIAVMKLYLSHCKSLQVLHVIFNQYYTEDDSSKYFCGYHGDFLICEKDGLLVNSDHLNLVHVKKEDGTDRVLRVQLSKALFAVMKNP